MGSSKKKNKENKLVFIDHSRFFVTSMNVVSVTQMKFLFTVNFRLSQYNEDKQ